MMQNTNQLLSRPQSLLPSLRGKSSRWVLLTLIFALSLLPNTVGDVTRSALIDAYLGVSVFVFATLLLFYASERLFKIELGNVFRKAKRTQVPIAAFLGMLPGCGGAVIVIAAYSSGNLSMGAVVAALTSTMGDAAFLLLAKRPDAALVVLPVSFAAGILAGYVTDLFYHQKKALEHHRPHLDMPKIGKLRGIDLLSFALFIPGLILGITRLAQVENPAFLEASLALPALYIIFFMRAISPIQTMTHEKDAPITRANEETAFITIWVIGAFLFYEYLTVFAGLDIEAMFSTIAPLLPLVAIAIGWIPGCGPQIVVTTLYINGLVPFAALIGNAISNDGDALFPAIAMNPKAAIIATLLSTIPAIIVAYGFYFLAPSFLN